MKIALLALFFFLLTFTKAEFVYDAEDNILSKDHSYRIAIGSQLGRSYITLENFGTHSCPLRLLGAAIFPGNPPPLPVQVLNHHPIFHLITTDMPLNFTFVDVPLCTKTSKWSVSLRLPQGEWDLFFDDENASGDFYIKKHGDKSYKIILCPDGEAESACGNVSYGEDGKHLAVNYGNDDPLEIRFEKVKSGISMVV